MRPRSLDQVVRAGLCAGCGLCAAASDGAVEMRLTERGFARPAARRPLPRAAEAALLDLCPGIRLTGPDAERVDPLWGPVLALRRAWAADPEIRFKGSSGGAISAVLAHLLASGEVDAVLQVGAAADRPLQSAGRVSLSVAEVVERAGSRYAPAATLAEIDRLLAAHGRVAVVGKPCDIAGLRAYARAAPEVDARIRYMISFFCAGVPSLRGTQILLRQMGVEESDLVRLRYRGEGWPGPMSAETRDGRLHRLSYMQSWGAVLHRHLQFRCKICPDGTGETADLVAADAWITADGHPDFEERDGVSAVLARTPRGAALLERCLAAGVLAAAPLARDELALMQPYQVERKRTVLARLAALALLGQRVPRYRRMRLWRNALRGGHRNVRSFAGTAWRLLGGRHRE